MTRSLTEKKQSTTEILLKSKINPLCALVIPPCSSVSPFSKEDLRRFVME